MGLTKYASKKVAFFFSFYKTKNYFWSIPNKITINLEI